MLHNALQRLLQSILVLLGCALMIFIMLRIIPGNPIAVLMGEHADTAVIERMTAELGLDQPILIQFFRYIGGALRGDFGTSYSLGKPVSTLIASAHLRRNLKSEFLCALQHTEGWGILTFIVVSRQI